MHENKLQASRTAKALPYDVVATPGMPCHKTKLYIHPQVARQTVSDCQEKAKYK